MPNKSLRSGDRLWTEGELATTLAVVETGKVGVWADSKLIGIGFPNMVVGESCILASDSREPRRTASVIALEDDTRIAEYPPEMVRDAFGTGVPRLVLRMLCGQVCRNALLTLAAWPAAPGVESSLRAMIQGAQDCEREIRAITSWDDFMVAFRLLYHLRDGSDAIRSALYDERDDDHCSATILTASKTMKALFKSSEIEPLLVDFLEGERLRRNAASVKFPPVPGRPS